MTRRMGIASVVLAGCLCAPPAYPQCRVSFEALHSGPELLYPAAGDFDGDGIMDVAVPSPAGVLEIRRGIGDGWFEVRASYALTGGDAAVTGDWNGDGKLDVAVGVQVFLGNGDGTFVQMPPAAQSRPYRAAASDQNGDGNQDIVGSDGLDVLTLLSNGDGTFQPAVTYVVGGASRPSVGDLNADGTPDVVVAEQSGSIGALLGKPDGTLDPIVSYPIGLGADNVTLADFDGNGTLDVACGESSTLLILFGNGDGTLQPPFAQAQPIAIWTLGAGDLDGDGTPDLVVEGAASGASSLCELHGNGDGTFALPVCQLTNQSGIQCSDVVEVRDMDADGHPDAFLHDYCVATLALGRGDGTFRDLDRYAQPFSAWPGPPWAVASGDVNGDGIADVACLKQDGSNYEVLLGTSSGALDPLPTGNSAYEANAMALRDFDGDGILDLAVSAGMLEILRGNGNGTFSPWQSEWLSSSGGSFMASGDLNGDGMPDLVLADNGPIAVVTVSQDGTISPPSVALGVSGVAGLALADLNRDGALDVAATERSATTIQVAFGNGDATFGALNAYVVGAQPGPVLAVDLNRDGALDLVVGMRQDATLAVLLNDGLGSFLPGGLYPAPGFWPKLGSLASADLDGDGNDDILVAYNDVFFGTPRWGNDVFLGVFRGDGSGGLSYLGALPGQPAHVAVADYDRNGAPDLAATDSDVYGRFALEVVRNTSLGMLPADFPDATLGVPYSRTETASGGTPPYAISLSQGILPPGLSLAPSGLLSGTPTTAGLYGFTLRVVDGAGCAREALRTLAVTAAGCVPLAISPDTLPQAWLGVPYAQALSATGSQPASFAIASGMLPPGLSLSPAGLVSGTPTGVGSYQALVAAVDAGGCVGSRSYTERVVRCPAMTLSPLSLPDAIQSFAYAASVSVSGGRFPSTYAISSGALPPGLLLHALTGVISGTPTAAGAFPFAITAKDANGCSISRIYVIDVRAGPDFVAAPGADARNPNQVRLFTRAGIPAGGDFLAYGAGAWGVNVGVGDIDGGLYADILAGPGPGPTLGPQVRAFRRDGTTINKVNFYAYGTLKYGVNVAPGDLDNDGFQEIVTGAGPGAAFGPHVRAFDFDGVALAPIAGVSFYAYGTLKYGVNVTSGDVDGDGFAELVTGAGPGAAFAATVRAFDHDGKGIRPIAKINLNAYALKSGVLVAGDDVDDDGYAEIATAPGPAAANPARFLGFDYDGSSIAPLAGFDVTPFASTYGGRLGFAPMEGTARWDLLCGAPFEPATEVRGYTYDGSSLSPLSGTPFVPFPAGYGANIAGGLLGL